MRIETRLLLILTLTTALAAKSAAPLDPKLEPGKTVYDQHCAACHGVSGDGNGPAAVWLYPKPRHFNSGLFKIKSTLPGFLPSDEDLFETTTRGMPGSSMPSFTYLNEQQRRDVVQYVKYLTAYVDETGKRINFFDEAKAKNEIDKPIQVPPEPPATVQALVKGQEMYWKLQCFTCHGETGEGIGTATPSLKDTWGFSLSARDFNTGAFRGGHTGRDLFLRTFTGLAGTPMPPFDETVLKPDDRWALVHYVQSLRRKEIEINDILQPTDGIIHAQKIKKLPTDPADPVWERLDPIRVPLNPLWPEPYPIPAVAIRAVSDGKQIALLAQWRDPIANGAPVRVQDFQDAIALQFSLDGSAPFLGMGDAQHPVNIWQWKAGWQQEVEGKRADVNTVYASMHADIYFQTNVLYRTAEAAGNLQAQQIHTSPIEDANAHGFGTMKAQLASSQNVKGKGVWFDGFWNVVFVRTLKSKDADDVQFSKDKPARIAFAVWDGERRDRNGRKVISNWYQLALEP